MEKTSVRLAQPADCSQLALLRHALWPQSLAEDHAAELSLILAGKPPTVMPMVIFVSQSDDGTLAGFIEVGLRSCAEGCDETHPVGYVEGWYVAENHRREGIAAELLRAAEEWARRQGCTELASDSQIANIDSQRVHEALGFEVVERSVNYRKSL